MEMANYLLPTKKGVKEKSRRKSRRGKDRKRDIEAQKVKTEKGVFPREKLKKKTGTEERPLSREEKTGNLGVVSLEYYNTVTWTDI